MLALAFDRKRSPSGLPAGAGAAEGCFAGAPLASPLLTTLVVCVTWTSFTSLTVAGAEVCEGGFSPTRVFFTRWRTNHDRYQ